MTHTRIPGLAILLTGALCSGAAPQSQPRPDPLAGPTISDQARAPTLVQRGYDGALRPLEAPPEVAALDLLGLDDDAWSSVQAVLAIRAGAIDSVVIRHVRTLVELQAATATGDKDAQRELLGTIVDELRPLQRSGRLVDQIAKALPEGKAPEYRRLVRERHMARFEELRDAAARDGSEHPDSEGFRRLIIESLGQEIQRSYERVVAQKTQDFERLIETLDLDQQTEGKVRRLVEDLGQKTALNPTPAQTREVITQIYRVLPPGARGRLLDALGRGDGG